MFQRLVHVLVVTIILYVVGVMLLALPLSHPVEVIYVLLAALYVAFGNRLDRAA